MQVIYSGADRAEPMRDAIIGMIDHTLNQTLSLSRGTNSVKMSARYAGEIAALTAIKNQIASIKLECNNS